MDALRGTAGPLLGLVAAVVLFLGSRGLDEVARGDQLGPGFWPRLVLIGLGLACLVKLISARRRPRAAGAHAAPPIERAKLAAGIGLIVLYVLATPAVGFALATAAFIVLFMWLAGARSVTALAASAAIGTVSLLYVFIKLVYLPLPKGAGPFEPVTLAFYRALGIF